MSTPGPVPPQPSAAKQTPQHAAKTWQVRLPDAKEFGLFTESEIRQLVREGAIPATAFLRRVDSQLWRPATSVLVPPALPRPIPPASPPTPPVTPPVLPVIPVISSAPVPQLPRPPALPPRAADVQATVPPPLPAAANAAKDSDKEKVLGCLAVAGVVVAIFIIYGLIRSSLTDSPVTGMKRGASGLILAKGGKLILAGLAALGGLGAWLAKEFFSPPQNKS